VRNLLARLLAKVGDAELMQTEFNRAISFAQTQGMDIDTFLKCWQHGDWDVLEKEFGYAQPLLPSMASREPTDVTIEITSAMTDAFIAQIPTAQDNGDQPSGKGSSNWSALQGDGRLTRCLAAAVAAAQPSLAGVALAMAPAE
jgi:hypothetical protein